MEDICLLEGLLNFLYSYRNQQTDDQEARDIYMDIFKMQKDYRAFTGHFYIKRRD